MDLGRLRLRLHLRGRLQVAFLALVASSLLLSAGAAYLVYSRRVASEIEPRVVQGRTVLQSSLQELIDRADALSYSYRTQPIFISRLEGTSSQGQFLDQFTLLLNQTNLDILDLVDIEGKLVIDKGFHIDRVGDSRLGLAGVREAVAGKKTRTIGLHDGSPAALVVVPIRNSSGQLDGGAVLGYRIDTKWLEGLKSALGSEVTLFVGGRVAASTLPGRTEGQQVPKELESTLGSDAKRLAAEPGTHIDQERLTRQERIGSISYLSHYTPIYDYRGGLLGVARLSLSLEGIQAANCQTITFLGLFNLVTLLIGYLIARMVSRRIVEPIREMQEAAKRIGQGRVGLKVRVETGDELEDLGGSLNTMSEQLHTLVSTLAVSNQRNRRVLESIADGVFAVDREGRITLFNPAAERLTGWLGSEVLGQSADRILVFRSGKEAVRLASYLPTLGAPGQVQFFRDLVLTTKGGEKHVTLTAAPLPTAPGEEIAGIATFYDMTKQFELDSLRQDFSFMIAHELKTPIAAIKGYLYLLEKSFQGPSEPQVNYLRRVNVAAKQL